VTLRVNTRQDDFTSIDRHLVLGTAFKPRASLYGERPGLCRSRPARVFAHMPINGRARPLHGEPRLIRSLAEL
jgi:hypothetical protein